MNIQTTVDLLGVEPKENCLQNSLPAVGVRPIKTKNPALWAGLSCLMQRYLIPADHDDISLTAISRCKANHHYGKPVFQNRNLF
jgi:hypothetical protein